MPSLLKFVLEPPLNIAMRNRNLLNGHKKKRVKKTGKNRKGKKNDDSKAAPLLNPSPESSLPKKQDAAKRKTDSGDVNSKKKPRPKSSAPSLLSGQNVGSFRSKSECLVRKFSTLSIGPQQRISPVSSYLSVKVRRLSTHAVSSLSQVADLIKSGKCCNIIVMAGAGLSTASGIPDFRTPGSGLYDNLAEYDIPYPTAVFDIDYFAVNPRSFFRLAKELYPGRYQPNFAHYFLRVLHERKRLLRLYTQNIDALERIAGIPEDKLVEAHGSFFTATCRRCKAKYREDDIKHQVLNGRIPLCVQPGCTGIIKPDIVFFGEDLPRRFFKFRADFSNCDLLMVLGTSLEVEPFANLVYEVQKSTPRLLINREVVGPFRKSSRRSNDVVCQGDLVEKLRLLSKMLNWTDDVEEYMARSGK